MIYISCNEDDDNSPQNIAFRAERLILCEDDVRIDNVYADNVIFEAGILEENEGYFLTFTVTNENNFSISGHPRFLIKLNEQRSIFGLGSDCLEIGPNLNCEFERFLRVNTFFENEIDLTPKIECFYYQEN